MDYNNEVAEAIEVCEAHLYRVEVAWIIDTSILPESYRIDRLLLSDAERCEWFTFNELQSLIVLFNQRWLNDNTLVLANEGHVQMLAPGFAPSELLAFNIGAVCEVQNA